MFKHDPELAEKLQEIAQRYGGTLREVHMVFRAELLRHFDPLEGGDGEIFVFPVELEEAARVPVQVSDLFPVIGPVPSPDARCDVMVALRQSMLDGRACEEILNSRPDFEVVVSVVKNQTDWLQFWTVRGFNEEFRQKAMDALVGWQEMIEFVLREIGRRAA